MLELEEALNRVLAAVPEPAPESVDLSAAAGRFLLERILSPLPLPPFTNSSMDGYAVRSNDTRGAHKQRPIALRLAGRVTAGSFSAAELKANECVRLFTGSALPAGSDAVVMQEDTQLAPDDPATVMVFDSVQPGENVRYQGEDVAAGSELVKAGMKLTAGHLSLLSATGVQSVNVGRPPSVGVLSTGTELRQPGQPLASGQIYESNRVALVALLRRAGAEATMLPLVRDDLEETRTVLGRALEEFDLVLTSGGVSVGEMDFIKPAFEQGGGELNFWKVAIKPGRPFVFGKRGAKLLFGLPGNPVSAMVTFLLLVRPAVLHWQGAAELNLPSIPGVLAEDLKNDGGRRHFMRVHLNARGQVRSAGLQASHALSSLGTANGLVDVAPQTVLRAGTQVAVLRIDD